MPQAIGDFLILAALRRTGGTARAVDEAALPEATRRAACEEGLVIGPEGAACLLALEELAFEGVIEPGQSAVIFQTGHPANY